MYANLCPRLQGHALFTRHAGGALPCPLVNYTAGFNDVYANMYGLAPGQDISVLFGAPFGEFVVIDSPVAQCRQLTHYTNTLCCQSLCSIIAEPAFKATRLH